MFFDRAVFTGIGALVSLAIAYVAVSRDLAFIRGQLTHLIKAVDDVQRIKETHAVMSMTLAEQGKDINVAHEKIRVLSKLR